LEYLAHFDKDKNHKQYLREHLGAVMKLIKAQIPPNVNFKNIDNGVLKEMCGYSGYFHDIGKYSDYFQEYLKEGKDSKYKNHAPISAVFLYNYLYKVLKSQSFDDIELRIILFLYYLSVKSHHSSLFVEASLFKNNNKELKIIEKHLINKAKEIIKDLGLKGKLKEEELINYFKTDIIEDKKNFEYLASKFDSGRISDPKWFFMIIYIFSLLIDTDKMDSAQIKINLLKTITPDKVTDYIKLKHGNDEKTPLINKREKARLSMMEVIDNMDDDEVKTIRFYTLTAPTGIGKTLSSLQSMLNLQRRIIEIEGYTPRIIIAIPFINIIEGNKEVYKEVIGEELKMVVHHGLSDFSAKEKAGKEIPIDKALLKTEAWDGDIILTTFVQLFQSIFTGENKPLKKINKLAGSIVILDEAQSVPEIYMPIIGAVLQMLAKYYGTRFVLMTATQPKILELGDKLFETCGYNNPKAAFVRLLPNHEEYFEGLKRTKFIPLLDEIQTNESFIELFFKLWTKEQSALIVVNTIKRSIDIFKLISMIIDKKKIKVPIYYLSTNIIPKKRREVIKEVSKILKAKEPVILVSTQTIEAGVNLDFDMGFRDFAPIDSLIQTAGRVNRSGDKEDYLPVYIIEFEKDNQYVYDLMDRELTKKLLGGKEKIQEADYVKLSEDYYNSVAEREISDQSRNLWESIIKLRFKKLQEFQLIKDIGETVDVFVETDESASAIADAYEAILKYDGCGIFEYDLSKALGEDSKITFNRKLGIFEIKALIKLIMTKMSDFIIQLRIKKAEKNRPIEFKVRGGVKSNLYWIPFEQLNEYYDENTGYIDDSGKANMY